ncbi:MAG: outer membrane beta-barrel protein [Gammaproteobacteria bacterium]
MKNTFALATLGAALALLSGHANAQERAPELDDGQLKPGETVADRRQDEYKSDGIRMGSFIANPSLMVRGAYDDNIFFQTNNTTDDLVTTISPAVNVTSNWENHLVKIDTGMDIIRYADSTAENAEDYWFTPSARIDVSRQTQINLSLDLRHGHEGRGDANAVNGDSPTETDTGAFSAEVEHRPGRFFLIGSAEYKNRSFDNVNTSTGVPINNQDRDRDEQIVSATLGYEIQPGYNAFVRGTASDFDYDSAVDDNGFNRDSSGVTAELGVELDLSGTVNGEIALGATNRDYDDARFDDTNSWSTRSQLFWQMSPLTTFVFNASRSISESTELNASGFLSTSFGVAMAHELRRNVVLEANVFVTENDFEGIARTDDLFGGTLSATWDINRNFHAGASYEYSERESDVAAVEYERNLFMIWAGYRL